MEMQFVHFNQLYGQNLMDAVAAANGEFDTLAIMAFFFEIADEPNEKMDILINSN